MLLGPILVAQDSQARLHAKRARKAITALPALLLLAYAQAITTVRPLLLYQMNIPARSAITPPVKACTHQHNV